MRELVWVGSSLDDLKEFPEVAQRGMGYARWLAQTGGKHPDAKPLKGFGGAGVLEVVDDDEGDTYRTIYTLTLSDAVYVLHAFQKKSKQGIATSQRDKKLIEQRLKWAREMHAERKQALGRDER